MRKKEFTRKILPITMAAIMIMGAFCAFPSPQDMTVSADEITNEAVTADDAAKTDTAGDKSENTSTDKTPVTGDVSKQETTEDKSGDTSKQETSGDTSKQETTGDTSMEKNPTDDKTGDTSTEKNPTEDKTGDTSAEKNPTENKTGDTSAEKQPDASDTDKTVTKEDFKAACDALTEAEKKDPKDEDAIQAAGKKVADVYQALSEEDKTAVADDWAKLLETYPDLVKKVTVTWYLTPDDETPFKTENVPEGESYEDLYPSDPEREGFKFTGWSKPETGEDGNIRVTALWEKVIPSEETIKINGKGDYQWQQTIVYHANYPGGEDPQITVHYDARGEAGNLTLVNTTMKTFDACGFAVPEGLHLKKTMWYAAADTDQALCSMGGQYNLDYKNRDTTIHFFAQYESDEGDNVFSMTYDANGGLVHGESLYENTVKTVATGYDFSSMEAEREGYEFLGWFTEKDGGEEAVWPKTLNTDNATATVYAHWKEIVHADAVIIYENGGGSGDQVKQTVPGSKKHTVKVPGMLGITAPADKVFSHWSNGETRYFPGDSFYPEDESTSTFTAVWKTDDSETADTSYTVQWFDADGHAVKPEETRKGTKGSPVSVTARDRFVDGYTFDETSENNLTNAVLEDNLVLKMYFTKDADPDGKIAVTWLNGYAEGDKNVIDSVRMAKEDDYSVLYPADPVREGWKFTGWNKPEADENGNVTITAQWEEITHKVSYEWEGLPEGHGQKLPDAANYGQNVSVTVDKTHTKESTVTVDGKTYVFSGWDRSDFTMPAEDVVIKGKWTVKAEEPVEKLYTVVYKDGADGSVFAEERHADLKADDVTPSFAGKTEREGYRFKGWTPSVKEKVHADDANADSEIVYTAEWEKVAERDKMNEKTYTVTYTDGVKDKVVFEDQVTKDLKAGDDTPKFKGTPTREGYTFTGWSPRVVTKVSGNVTYTARWKKVTESEKTYTVTYTDGVRDKVIFEDQVTKDLKAGDATPEFKGTPTREGYTFIGWSPSVVTKVTGNVTYTARWKAATTTSTSTRTNVTNKTSNTTKTGNGTSTDKTNTSKAEVVKTGQNTYLLAGILGLMLMSAGVYLAYRKKH